MFLQLLTEESHKEYFLNLAYLVAISDGKESRLDVSDVAKQTLGGIMGAVVGADYAARATGVTSSLFSGARHISNTLKSELDKQKTRVDDAEINMIKLFMFEMDYIDYINDLESFEAIQVEENLDAWIRESRKEISQAPDAKKMIMMSLVDKDVDITTLSQVDIENELMNNPETRSRIFAMAGNLAAQKEDVNLTMTQKKAVTFELVGMAYADGSFSEIELATVKSISKSFGLDEETFEDICGYVNKLNQISAESLELIQE